ncbi:MAG: type III-B CRISPR module RAMP protein Cmr1 [Deltaproteobacteria bacterium]|nr:MAG: type III-B CRISPR module RAMP protein Cmr1 [Deltaproteobacteria bacterium]
MSLEEVKLDFEVVTPMFLGGASPNAEAELRPPSIKGMLRWWFRALGGSKEWEDKIFGAAGEKTGRSTFKITVGSPTSGTWEFDRKKYKKFDRRSNNCNSPGIGTNGIVYAGYSLTLGQNQRKAIASGSVFTLTVIKHPSLGRNEFEFILNLFWLMGHIGGIGTRWRRGFGSISLKKGQKILPISATTSEAWKEEFRSAWQTLKNELVKFTRNGAAGLWYLDKIYIWKNSFGSWEEALNDIAITMQIYRQCRNPDHDLVLGILRNPNRYRSGGSAPQRTTFGMPITFRFRKAGTKPVTFLPQFHERMASPLIFHIAKLGTTRYLPVLVKLRGPFLENSEQIQTRGIKLILKKPSTTLDGDGKATILIDFIEKAIKPKAMEVIL